MYNKFVLSQWEETSLFKPERLVEWRKKKKLTQEQLALRVKTTKGTISNYENGHSTPPHETLVAIADVLGISTDYLLGRTDDPTPPQQPSTSRTNIPSWATKKDIRDFKRMLEEDAPVMFDGVPLDEEDREKVMRVMEAIFWDAKKRNKRKPVEE
jgi:transcriptional regulator with XRE-family HTH domain